MRKFTGAARQRFCVNTEEIALAESVSGRRVYARRFEMLGCRPSGKSHQRKVAQEYLANDRRDKLRANKLWTAMFVLKCSVALISGASISSN